MMVLLVCSIVTVGFAFERWFFFMRSATDTKGFMKKLGSKIKSGNHSAALQMCEGERSAVSRIMAQGLSHAGRTREEVQQRINTAIEVEQVEMERHLNVLGTMSNIAPLLGLFGTVIGIIRAFAAIARTGSGGSAVVAMGVAEALMTTAAGIVVAVIATVCFNIFVRRIRTRTIDLEDAREEFFAMVSTAARPGRRTERASSAAHSVAQSSSSQEPAPAGFLS